MCIDFVNNDEYASFTYLYLFGHTIEKNVNLSEASIV